MNARAAVQVHRVLAPNPGVMTLDGTNSWVLTGPDGSILVDPGPDDSAHLDHLFAQFHIVAVALTHRHEDHSDAVPSLPSTLPIYAADPWFARYRPAVTDGDIIEAGGVRMRVMATPGHTEDSVCFGVDTADGPALLTGDTLLGRQHATYVSRVGGSLDAVLDSLGRIALLPPTRGLPGHGEPIPDVARAAADARAHRLARIEQLAQRLRSEPEIEAAAIARERHPDAPERWRASEWIIHTELEYARRVVLGHSE